MCACVCVCVCVGGGGGDRVVRGEGGGVEWWGEGKVSVYICVLGGREGMGGTQVC